MQFKKSLSIILATTQALLINAEKVTFKVIAVTGEPSVTVDGTPYAMQIDEYPVYKIEVDVSQLPVEYSYSLTENGSVYQEQFTRTRQTKKALNDFFNRSQTVVEHPQLPRAYPAFPTFVQSKLYDDNHVGTIIIECDPMQLQTLHSSTEASSEDKVFIPAKVIYANPYTIRTFKQAQLGLSGQSTRHVPKLSYKIRNLENEENKELFNRSSIKLRAEHMDPTLIRDKLYGDILNSLGVPAAQNKYARLFINGEAIGLFDLTDDITSTSYLSATYNKGKKFSKENSLFKADFCPTCEGGPGFADLGYYGDDPSNSMYSIYSYKGDDKTTKGDQLFTRELLPVLKDIQDYSMSGDASKMPFDIETFLKYMAMEFIAGGVDNYWNRPGNFYLFKDTDKNQWHFHDSDFHYSFGCGGNVSAMKTTPLAEYPPLLEENVGKERPPLDAIRKSPENETKLKEIFQRLLNTAFHPKALYPRIESLANLIREDIEWDFSLPRVNPNPTAGTDINYTVEDFNTHITEEGEVENDERIPIKSFLKTRIDNLVQELGIQVPADFENDIGYVDFSSIEGEDTSNALSIMASWKLFTFTTFLTILLFMLFY